jgi:hypothetical protein
MKGKTYLHWQDVVKDAILSASEGGKIQLFIPCDKYHKLLKVRSVVGQIQKPTAELLYTGAGGAYLQFIVEDEPLKRFELYANELKTALGSLEIKVSKKKPSDFERLKT